ncbi:MAG: 4Fe-4S binding protein [Endomicrobiales bacterium]|jgi:ferredoxin
MAYFIDQSVCVGCGACEGTCPVTAISPDGDKYKIDPAVCTDCGSCAEVCPVSAISKK